MTFPELTLEGDGITIRVNFTGGDEDYMLADGHVSFTSDKGVRTFDRRGVEDSFYVDNPRKQYSNADPTGSVNETIRDFIERRVPESRARIAGQEEVPGFIGRLISADQKAKVAAGETVRLIPAGFGIGYALRSTPFSGASRGSAEQARFFSVPEVWIASFDCD